MVRDRTHLAECPDKYRREGSCTDAVQLLAWHRSMLRIRTAEERIGELVSEKKVICPAHLSIGQEAVAVGVCSALNVDDYVFGTHRAHGHYLAKGGDLKAMMAEVLGRKTGCSGGRGGSMHLVQPEVGVMGTSSIVGGCFPISVGAGLASAIRKDGRVSVVFFGDGAMDEGVFYEALNFASIKKLPVMFICENNYYATHLRICRRINCNRDKSDRNSDLCDCDQLMRRADFFNIPVKRIDGNDVKLVADAASEAVDHVRSGNGPYYLECITYRWRGHVGPNWDVDMGLRSQSEIDSWIKRCPIKRLEAVLESRGALSETHKAKIYGEVLGEVEDAVAYAMKSDYPAAGSVTKNVYRD